jgi:26S proteasome non-ATPase regulatory subunit 10
MLDADPSAINSHDEDERQPLHWACTGGHVELCRLLIDRGARVDAQDESGWTALHIASSAGREQIVDILLTNSDGAALEALVNEQTETGQTALHYASSKGHTSIVERLLSLDGVVARVELSDNQGQTALHRAASKGLLPVCRMLLNYRRQLLDLRDRQGNTALHLACEEDRGAVAEMLIVEFGARIDIENNEKKTAPQQCPSRPLQQHLQNINK